MAPSPAIFPLYKISLQSFLSPHLEWNKVELSLFIFRLFEEERAAEDGLGTWAGHPVAAS